MLDYKEVVNNLNLNEFSELYNQTIIDYIYGNHVAGHIKYINKDYFVDIYFPKEENISLENAYKVIKNKDPNIEFIKTTSGRFHGECTKPLKIKIVI